jgi:hypothetical protein
MLVLRYSMDRDMALLASAGGASFALSINTISCFVFVFYLLHEGSR